MEEHAPHQQTRRPFWKCHYVCPPPLFSLIYRVIAINQPLYLRRPCDAPLTVA